MWHDKFPWHLLRLCTQRIFLTNIVSFLKENVYPHEIKTLVPCFGIAFENIEGYRNFAIGRNRDIADTTKKIKENKRIKYFTNMANQSHLASAVILFKFVRNIRSKRFRAKTRTNYALLINVALPYRLHNHSLYAFNDFSINLPLMTNFDSLIWKNNHKDRRDQQRWFRYVIKIMIFKFILLYIISNNY